MTDHAGRGREGEWLVDGERPIYESAWVQMLLAAVELPDGSRFEHHVIRLRRAAIAAVIDEQDDRVLMMWRHRFVPDRWGWELPGGLIEEDEDPAVAAAREIA